MKTWTKPKPGVALATILRVEMRLANTMATMTETVAKSLYWETTRCNSHFPTPVVRVLQLHGQDRRVFFRGGTKTHDIGPRWSCPKVVVTENPGSKGEPSWYCPRLNGLSTDILTRWVARPWGSTSSDPDEHRLTWPWLARKATIPEGDPSGVGGARGSHVIYWPELSRRKAKINAFCYMILWKRHSYWGCVCGIRLIWRLLIV